MKFKFRAEKKDFVMFGIAFVVVSYILAITVINIYGVFRPGFKFTLSPIPKNLEILAYIIIAIIGFFSIVIASLSSLFFEREKGFGITTQQKS